jgi:hypothetical protein
MPSTEILFGDDTSKGHDFAGVRCSLIVSEDEGIVELLHEFNYSESGAPNEKFEIRHKSTISNPIELLVTITALKGKYAYCLAIGTLASVAKEVVIAYDDSKSKILPGESPTIKQRCMLFAESVRGRTANLKGGIASTLVTCTAGAVVYPLIFPR